MMLQWFALLPHSNNVLKPHGWRGLFPIEFAFSLHGVLQLSSTVQNAKQLIKTISKVLGITTFITICIRAQIPA